MSVSGDPVRRATAGTAAPAAADGRSAAGAGLATDDDVDAWRRAGLYDPDAPGAAARLELLRWVASHGCTIEQMVDAAARRQLGSLPSDLAIRPGAPRRSLREVAELLGASMDAVAEIRRASGLPPVDPDEPAFTPDDLVMLRSFVEAGTIFSTSELLHFTRVMGTSMRRVADAAQEMFFLDVEARMLRDRPDSQLAVGRKSLEAVQLVGASILKVFEPLFRAHLEESNRAFRAARASATDLATAPFAVGFVDLSGYTARSAQLTAADLLALVLDFESHACDLVADHGGRVVKLIGDEVMFTTVEATAACEIAARLVTEMAERLQVLPRGGIAHGPVVAHGGDLYGDTVNRAARMADIAVPGEVLVDERTVEATSASGSERWTTAFEPAGRRLLKGFAQPIRLWSLIC